MTRTIAIDWSGAKHGARRKIWLAEVREGRCIRLESGRSREQLTSHLISEAKESADLIVGLDFAFSFPEWFLQARSLSTAPELWSLAINEGEQWLSECAPPFWGRPGTRRPQLPEHFRRTESALPSVKGIRPKSTFQIGGAGAVGTGSIRGMPVLAQLRHAGFSIWPFDGPALPMIVEIYPRVLTSDVAKTNATSRARYLDAISAGQDGEIVEIAAGSEDAFDAFVSALVMDEHRDEFPLLTRGQNDTVHAEGVIWAPMDMTASHSEHSN